MDCHVRLCLEPSSPPVVVTAAATVLKQQRLHIYSALRVTLPYNKLQMSSHADLPARLSRLTPPVCCKGMLGSKFC